MVFLFKVTMCFDRKKENSKRHTISNQFFNFVIPDYIPCLYICKGHPVTRDVGSCMSRHAVQIAKTFLVPDILSK